jgi:hypothetical protein
MYSHYFSTVPGYVSNQIGTVRYLFTYGNPVETSHLIHLLELGHELLALAALLRGNIEQPQLATLIQHLLHHPAFAATPFSYKYFRILKCFLFKSVFRIRDILIRIGILGSVYLITDPALFWQWLSRCRKILISFCLFELFLTIGALTSVFKDKMSLRSQNHRNHGLS